MRRLLSNSNTAARLIPQGWGAPSWPGPEKENNVMFVKIRMNRLRELSLQRPMFGDVFDFYSHLYEFFGRKRPSFLGTSLDPGNQELRRKEGFPLLRGELLDVDSEKAGIFLREMIVILQTYGHQGTLELGMLKEAFAEGEADIPRLFRACLDRDRRPLSEFAEKLEGQAALLQYVLGLALSYGLQRCREEGLSAASEGWSHGHCPLCGGLPVMGELAEEEGKKKLQCGICATSWEFIRLKCAHCGNTEHETLEYFTAHGERGYRVDICRKCSCYLKVLDSREVGKGLPLDIEDIATLHLDVLAQKEGFTQGKKNPGDPGGAYD
jgi:FdhE protein